jgi:hypothetical protein
MNFKKYLPPSVLDPLPPIVKPVVQQDYPFFMGCCFCEKEAQVMWQGTTVCRPCYATKRAKGEL